MMRGHSGCYLHTFLSRSGWGGVGNRRSSGVKARDAPACFCSQGGHACHPLHPPALCPGVDLEGGARSQAHQVSFPSWALTEPSEPPYMWATYLKSQFLGLPTEPHTWICTVTRVTLRTGEVAQMPSRGRRDQWDTAYPYNRVKKHRGLLHALRWSSKVDGPRKHYAGGAGAVAQ